MRRHLIGGVALAAMGIAGADAAGAQVPASPPTQLTLTADGVVTGVPDLVTLSAGVTSQGPSAAAALADNARVMDAVVSALRRAGVADRDVQTDRIALTPQLRYPDNAAPVVTGYQAHNGVTVRFREVARTGAILDALVAAGANEINGPSFGFADPDAALDEARGRAVATARARAELYARAAGLHVRRIVSLEEREASQPGPVVPMMALARRAAATPVMAGSAEQRVSVAVVFELD